MKLIRHKKGRGALTVPYHTDAYCSPLNLHLFAKVIEELNEIYDANFQDPEEYADILQVIFDMAEVNGFDLREISKIRVDKKKTHGDFKKGHLKL